MNMSEVKLELVWDENRVQARSAAVEAIEKLLLDQVKIAQLTYRMPNVIPEEKAAGIERLANALAVLT